MKNTKNQYSIGVDIGGTNIKAVLFDGKKVLADSSLSTPKNNLRNLVIMIKALIEPLEKKAKKDKIKITGVGLSLAHPVDYEKQKTGKSPNLSILDDCELAKILERKIKHPVKMDNDGNCFLLAEKKIGAGIDCDNIYGITLGTSIGSSWWYKGEIYRGFHGGGGELCHTIIDYPNYISLEQAYQKLTQNNPAHLAEEAFRGDDLAQKSFQEIGQIIGISLANVINMHSPEIIIIGGGVVESSSLFLGEAKKIMKKYVLSSEMKKTKIIKSKLGNFAGAIGAALLVI